MEHSETEGVIKVISNYKTPSVIFLRKNDSPLKDEAEARIEFDIDYEQLQKFYSHLHITKMLFQIFGQDFKCHGVSGF